MRRTFIRSFLRRFVLSSCNGFSLSQRDVIPRQSRNASSVTLCIGYIGVYNLQKIAVVVDLDQDYAILFPMHSF